MRVLVYPHATEIGGSQLNAVEIAAAVRDRGHEVIVVSRPGPLVDVIGALGLPHVPLDPRAVRRPSRFAAAQLTELARQHRCDVVHGYEWPPGLEAFAGPRLRLGLPAVCTVMSMAVAPFLPRTMPLIVSSDQIRRRAISSGFWQVGVLEPPVDVRANAPGLDPGAFRADHGLRPDAPVVALVSRLAAELKLESLLAACDAAGELAASGTPVQLVIVGDGPARPLVEEAAAAADARAGRRVVALTGMLIDPRPAYAVADVVIGMGLSAQKGAAFAKPVVVLGERGFCEVLTPESAAVFARQGWYGAGPPAHGRAEMAARLAGVLRELLADPARRAGLGEFGRSLAAGTFSLDHAAAVQLDAYARAVETCAQVPRLGLATDATRSALGVTHYKARRKVQRWRGTVVADDFNNVTKGRGRPVAG